MAGLLVVGADPANFPLRNAQDDGVAARQTVVGEVAQLHVEAVRTGAQHPVARFQRGENAAEEGESADRADKTDDQADDGSDAVEPDLDDQRQSGQRRVLNGLITEPNRRRAHRQENERHDKTTDPDLARHELGCCRDGRVLAEEGQVGVSAHGHVRTDWRET